MQRNPGLFDTFYRVIARIPRGKVATYGQVAALAGHPGAARMVGWALHALPGGSEIPWHRVINARGGLSLSDEMSRRLQQALLEAEGVDVDHNGKVDLEVYRWPGD